MADIEITLSDPEAVERYRTIVEAVLLAGGALTETTLDHLKLRAAELEVHRLDAEMIMEQTLALPSVQAVIALHAAQRQQAESDHETLLAELRRERKGSEELADQLNALNSQQATTSQNPVTEAQVRQLQSQVETLQQRLAALERRLDSISQPPPVAASAPVAAPTIVTPGVRPPFCGMAWTWRAYLRASS